MESSPFEPLVKIKFLYKEISLLEGGKCEEWISMLTDDVRYYMPVSLVTRNGDLDGRDIHS
jgi:3-phenylpropionate/cinnamic acid dioxygenase small subunit